MVLRTKGAVPGLRVYLWGKVGPRGSAPVHTPVINGYLSAELCPLAETIAGSSFIYKPSFLGTQAVPRYSDSPAALDRVGLAGAKAARGAEGRKRRLQGHTGA